MTEESASVVAITGVSGQLGGALAQLLDEDDRVRKVVGLDIRPMDQRLTKTQLVQQDISEPGLETVFRQHGVTHVAHFAFVLDTIHDRKQARRIDVDGSCNVLKAAAAVAATKVLFSSSSVVFGAYPDNPPSIPEGHARRPHPRIQYTLDKVAVEQLCEEFQKQHSGTKVVVLRPVTIVGPRMSNFLSRFMDKPILVLPWGHDPPWQVVHEIDCARAAQEMLFNDLSGFYNLGADGTVPLSEILKRCNRPIVRVPRTILKGLAELCWRLGLYSLSEINGPLVDYLCFVPVLDSSRLKREAGFVFRYTTREALDDFFQWRQKDLQPSGGKHP
jgi:UDP-glucose 4-epimerase